MELVVTLVALGVTWLPAGYMGAPTIKNKKKNKKKKKKKKNKKNTHKQTPH